MANKSAVKPGRQLGYRPKLDAAGVTGFFANKRFYQQVLESMKEGVSLSDESGIIIYTNPSEDKMFGYKRGELVGQHVSVQNTYPPHENQRIVKEVIRHLKQKGIWQGEFNNRKKDGTTFTTSAKITALELGGKQCWLCVQVDITESKLASQKLRETEERFQRLIERSSDLIALSDVAGNYSYVSPGIKKVLGYTPEEFVHMNGFSLMHPDELERIGNEFKKLLNRPGSSRTIELRARHKNGTWRWLEATATNLLHDPKIGGIVSNFRDITERKQAEEALRESEARAVAVYDQAAVAMSITSLDGKWIDFNRVYPKMFGYSRSELMKMDYSHITHPDDRAADNVNIRLLIKGEVKEFTREKRYIHKSGSLVYVYIHVTAVRNDKGEPQYIVAVLQDITERKKNEMRQLFLDKVSDTLFASFEDDNTIRKVAKLIVRHIADYCRIAIVNEDGTLSDITVNHTDPSKVQLAKDLYDQYKDDPNATQGVLKILKTGKAEIIPLIDEKTYESIKDNPKLLMAIKAIGLRSYMGIPLIAHDKIIGAITFSSATPERVYDKKDLRFVLEVGQRIALAIENARARRELLVSEERFRSLADSMPQIVWTARPDGYTDYYNRQWYKYTGFAAANDQGWKTILHPEDMKTSVEAWEDSVQTGKPYQIEYRFKDRSRPGKYRWFLGRALPVKNAKGEIIKWFGTCTDIDNIRRTIQRKQQLEKITSALTAQRTELVALNRAKDEFISLASHQLRTPATGVKQYLGMTLEGYAGEITEPQRAFLQQAYESNERQINIVNDLLQVAKIDAGKVILEKQKMDLIPLIYDIIQEQNKVFSDRRQKVVFMPQVKVLETIADLRRMRMVLENIIDNASKYTPPTKQIEIMVTQAKDQVHITVKDEGVGMPAADIDKIFEKFSRLDNPLSVAVGGSGLGLYWAKKITDLHGGTINVESVPGKGSAFTISLPIAKGSRYVS